MESRWSVPPGKTLAETKVSERRKELHVTAARLGKITAHLTRNERMQAIQDVEEEKVRKIKETSEEMTKNWTDSIQRQHAARQAELEEMLNKQDDRNLVRFLSVRKEQEAERKMYVNAVRQKLLLRKDFPKALESAYLFSEVLYERDKQKEFKKEIQAHHAKVAQQEVADMWQDVANYNQEEAEKKKALKEKNLAFAAELKNDIEALRQAKEKVHADKVKEELLDQERALREAEHIEKMRSEKLVLHRKQVKDNKMEAINAKRLEDARVIEEAKNTEAVRKIMQISKDRIQAMMKQKDRDLQEARIAKGLSTFDNTMQLKREAELNMMYEKGAEKFDADEKARDEAARQNQSRLRQEIIDEHASMLQRNAEAKLREREKKKWEMLNRFKVIDQERKYQKQLQEKADEQRKILKQEHDNELELKKEKMQKETAEEIAAIIEKNQRHDREYMQYAQEVRQLAVEQGWSTVPIDKVTNKYRYTVMGDAPPNACKAKQPECGNKAHSSVKPGRRTHCPASDPSVRCIHQRDHLLK